MYYYDPHSTNNSWLGCVDVVKYIDDSPLLLFLFFSSMSVNCDTNLLLPDKVLHPWEGYFHLSS